ncbi:hypothetical protein HK098_007861 [Nowakowskiella sp. JEL0407]|nr:hypothetical protein HK098_007861 [Nowakowskiella sp. JEL0407]
MEPSHPDIQSPIKPSAISTSFPSPTKPSDLLISSNSHYPTISAPYLPTSRTEVHFGDQIIINVDSKFGYLTTTSFGDSVSVRKHGKSGVSGGEERRRDESWKSVFVILPQVNFEQMKKLKSGDLLGSDYQYVPWEKGKKIFMLGSNINNSLMRRKLVLDQLDAVETEFENNEKEISRVSGTNLHYGQTIHLYSPFHNKYLSLSSDTLAHSPSHHTLTLDALPSRSSLFRIIPKYRAQKIGEKVRFGDAVYVQCDRGGFLYCGVSGGGEVWNRIEGWWERSASSGEMVSAWNLGVVKEFDGKVTGKKRVGVSGGDIIRLYNYEKEVYLSSKRNSEKIYLQYFKFHAGRPKELDDPQIFWEICYQEEHSRKNMTIGEICRLKSVVSGKYMAVKDGSAYLTDLNQEYTSASDDPTLFYFQNVHQSTDPSLTLYHGAQFRLRHLETRQSLQFSDAIEQNTPQKPNQHENDDDFNEREPQNQIEFKDFFETYNLSNVLNISVVDSQTTQRLFYVYRYINPLSYLISSLKSNFSPTAARLPNPNEKSQQMSMWTSIISELIIFCTNSDNLDAMTRVGPPVVFHQVLLRDVGIIDIIADLLCLVEEKWIVKIEGGVEWVDIMGKAVVNRAYRLLYVFLLGDDRLNELYVFKHFKLIQSHLRLPDSGASQTLMELVEESPIVLERLQSEDILVFIDLLLELQDPYLIGLMVFLCFCEGSPNIKHQILIANNLIRKSLSSESPALYKTRVSTTPTGKKIVEILINNTAENKYKVSGNSLTGRWIAIEDFAPSKNEERKNLVASMANIVASSNASMSNDKKRVIGAESATVDYRIKFLAAQLQLLNVLCKGENHENIALVTKGMQVSEEECRICIGNENLSSEIRALYCNLYITLFIESLSGSCVPENLIISYDDIIGESEQEDIMKSAAEKAAALTNAFTSITSQQQSNQIQPNAKDMKRKSIAKVHPSMQPSFTVSTRKSFVGGRSGKSSFSGNGPAMSKSEKGNFSEMKRLIKEFLNGNASQSDSIQVNNLIASILNVLRILIVEEYYTDAEINDLLTPLLEVLDGRNDSVQLGSDSERFQMNDANTAIVATKIQFCEIIDHLFNIRLTKRVEEFTKLWKRKKNLSSKLVSPGKVKISEIQFIAENMYFKKLKDLEPILLDLIKYEYPQLRECSFRLLQRIYSNYSELQSAAQSVLIISGSRLIGTVYPRIASVVTSLSVSFGKSKGDVTGIIENIITLTSMCDFQHDRNYGADEVESACPDAMSRKILSNFKVCGLVLQILTKTVRGQEKTTESVNLISACTRFLRYYAPDDIDQELLFENFPVLNDALKFDPKSIYLLLSICNSAENCIRLVNESLLNNVVEIFQHLIHEEQSRSNNLGVGTLCKKYVKLLMVSCNPEPGVFIKKNQTYIIRKLVQCGVDQLFCQRLKIVDFTIEIFANLFKSCCIGTNSIAISTCQQNIPYKYLLTLLCDVETSFDVRCAVLSFFYNGWLEPILGKRQYGDIGNSAFSDGKSVRALIQNELSTILQTTFSHFDRVENGNETFCEYLQSAVFPVISMICKKYSDAKIFYNDTIFLLLNESLEFFLKITSRLSVTSTLQGSMVLIEELADLIWSAEQIPENANFLNDKKQQIDSLKNKLAADKKRKIEVGPPPKIQAGKDEIAVQEHYSKFVNDTLLGKSKDMELLEYNEPKENLIKESLKEEFENFLKLFNNISEDSYCPTRMLLKLINEKLDFTGDNNGTEQEVNDVQSLVLIITALVNSIKDKLTEVRDEMKKVEMGTKIAETTEELLKMQNWLHSMGATELAIRMTNSFTGVYLNSGMELLKVLLEGGNSLIQRRMLDYFKANQEETFFYLNHYQLRQEIEYLDEIKLVTTMSCTAHELNRRVEPIKTLEKKRIKNVILQLRVLQLVCEGHFSDFQNYLREQPDNIKSFNLVSDCVDLLRTMIALEVRFSSTPFRIPEGYLSVEEQILDTLIEFEQGCVENQVELFNCKILNIIMDILKWLYLSPVASKDNNKQNLIRSKAVLCLFSLLEGTGPEVHNITKETAKNLDFNLMMKVLDTAYDWADYEEDDSKAENLYLEPGFRVYMVLCMVKQFVSPAIAEEFYDDDRDSFYYFYYYTGRIEVLNSEKKLFHV